MEYDHEQAVADGVNVNYDIYRTRTQVSEAGGKVESGYYVDLRDSYGSRIAATAGIIAIGKQSS